MQILEIHVISGPVSTMSVSVDTQSDRNVPLTQIARLGHTAIRLVSHYSLLEASAFQNMIASHLPVDLEEGA